MGPGCLGRAHVLVSFGATGDLVYKQVFPSLASMVARGRLDVPVIGVAHTWEVVDRVLDNTTAPHLYRPGLGGLSGRPR